MLSDELRNRWKEEIEEDWIGTGETIAELRRYILQGREISYQQGEIARLEESLKHYKQLYDEEECSCLHCTLGDSDDDDEEGRGRDGLPRRPKPVPEISDEESNKLGRMWDKE